MLLNKRVPVTYILGKIKAEIVAITIFSFAIGYLDEQFKFLTIPIAAPTILGTTISLLLAFRTAQAYDRWWEGRIVWGSIVNSSRSFIREIQAFLEEDTNSKQRVSSFAKRHIGWCYVLGQKLRNEPYQNTLEKYLSKEEISKIQNHNNIPNAILDLQAQEIRKLYASNLINQFQQIQLINNVSKLCDYMGMCERIKTTVFPKTYSAMLHGLIYVFAAMLPFSLTDYPPFVEEILNIIISSAFFLIEKTAIYKQDPFEGRATDTPMTSIARNIEINLLQMIEAEPVPQPLEAKKYYIM